MANISPSLASETMPLYTYNARTAWALLQLAEATGTQAYRDAAVRNIEFALGEQLPNGWFKNNCLNDPDRPLLHTIGYTLEGVVEVGISLSEATSFLVVRRAADELLADCGRTAVSQADSIAAGRLRLSTAASPATRRWASSGAGLLKLPATTGT